MSHLVDERRMVANNIRPAYKMTPAVYRINPIRHYRKGYSQSTSNQISSTMVTATMDTPGQVHPDSCQGIGVTNQVYTSGVNKLDISRSLKLLRNRKPMTKFYSQNYSQYLQKRCKTYEQRNFNFAFDTNTADKPGSPYTLNNEYLSNCIYIDEAHSTPANCRMVVYKPNNFKYAKQGAVSSWLRTNQVAQQTISTNNYLQQFCVKR